MAAPSPSDVEKEEGPRRRVAMVHYHLRRGGVTRVLESAREILEARGDSVVVLSGEAPLPGARTEGVRVVPALNYRRAGSTVVAESLAEELARVAADALGGPPDLWHFHNHSLAKNVMLPSVIREIASRGGRCLLQIHDFPEDGRPENYSKQRSFFDSPGGFEEALYPTARQIHYATINRRDHDFLRAAGIRAGNLHVLPNAIPDLAVTTRPQDRPFSRGKLFAFYPTRGIRRKNLGEILLLALIYGDRIDFATSMRPENPEWQAVHDEWSDLAEELALPVTFGLADEGGHPFLDLLGWSDLVVTTSIAEGFGLAFLEPWIVGKPVIGRDLPEITRDFAANGIHLGNLYRRIDVPRDWLDEGELLAAVESMLRRSYLAYDCPLPRNAAKQTLQAWTRQGRIDFGVLSEPFQMKILRRLRADPGQLDRIAIPPLALYTEREIAERRELIRAAYSPERYGEGLSAIYGRVLRGGIGKVRHLPTRKVLAQFLHPARLNLLRNG
jgi:glycosyltransferase involved in cell wall biosynthesis